MKISLTKFFLSSSYLTFIVGIVSGNQISNCLLKIFSQRLTLLSFEELCSLNGLFKRCGPFSARVIELACVAWEAWLWLISSIPAFILSLSLQPTRGPQGYTLPFFPFLTSLPFLESDLLYLGFEVPSVSTLIFISPLISQIFYAYTNVEKKRILLASNI